MSNVTAIRTESADLFAGITEEQVIEKALSILEERHQPGELLTSSPDTRRLLRLRMADLPYEVFGGVFVDNRHRVIALRELFKGTIDGAAVYPREVARTALELNAAAVIFYHNHPSGECEPSQADINLTRRLKESLGLLDIRVLDHVVVSGNDSVSLAERGLM